MNYQETIDFLYNQLPMFSRIGASAITPGLDNTYRLCEKLGYPERNFKSIHIAGTNGKGSTSHMLAAILQNSGYTTGLYTSPHLWDFRERIRINGELMEKQAVADFVEEIMPLIEELKPSFFEITVAMAFKYFSDNKVDFAIIETGMGGRLDSTNVIRPELSVITNIGMDHTDKLGNTLEAIAREKAGIIKLNTPVIIGATHPDTSIIFREVAAEMNAPIYFADQIWRNIRHYAENNLLHVEYFNAIRNQSISIATDQLGVYQVKNIPGVLEAVARLREKGYDLPEDKMMEAFTSVAKLTGLRGRWETLCKRPKIVADVCHNVDGLSAVLQQPEIQQAEKLHIILGMVRDKDISGMLSLLPKEAAYYITRANIPRAFSEEELLKKVTALGLKASKYPEVNAALESAVKNAGSNDLILACGSFFLIAELDLESIKKISLP